MHKLTISLNNCRRAICETTNRYDIHLNGNAAAEIYFNTRGYVVIPASLCRMDVSYRFPNAASLSSARRSPRSTAKPRLGGCDMQRFFVTTQATAEIEEVWEVSAENEEAAREIVDDGNLHQHSFIRDKVIGEERDRDILSVTLASSMGEPRCQCQNCDWQGSVDKAEPIHDFWSRVAPGEIMPAGDCPECGALVHLIKGGDDVGNY